MYLKPSIDNKRLKLCTNSVKTIMFFLSHWDVLVVGKRICICIEKMEWFFFCFVIIAVEAMGKRYHEKCCSST